MIDASVGFAFAGNAFLKPEPAHLVELAREMEDDEWVAAIEEQPEVMEQEYNRLFLNPGGSPCALWQSACGEESRLMGQPHLDALEWFRRYGIEPAAGNEPADHIGLLLLFYANLLRSGADEEELQKFREGHLLWVIEFCRTLERNTAHPFYLLLAKRTRELVQVP